MEDEVVAIYKTVMSGGCAELTEQMLELVGVPSGDRSVREERRVDAGVENGELWPAVVREYQSGAIEVESNLGDPDGVMVLRLAGRADGTQAATAQEALLALGDAMSRFV